jgi:hypothetical protein
MDKLREMFKHRTIPGPPCSMGLLLDNVKPEDHKSLTEAMELIKQKRAERGSRSNLPPNAAWLTRLIRHTMGIDLPREVIQRHMRGDCRCRRETR